MNNHKLRLTKPSQEDIHSSEIFYENQNSNLGVYFYDNIISDLDALKFYAGIHEKYFGFYRMLTRRFPYAIYYDIEDKTVVVHAILHTKRDIFSVRKRLLFLRV